MMSVWKNEEKTNPNLSSIECETFFQKHFQEWIISSTNASEEERHWKRSFVRWEIICFVGTLERERERIFGKRKWWKASTLVSWMLVQTHHEASHLDEISLRYVSRSISRISRYFQETFRISFQRFITFKFIIKFIWFLCAFHVFPPESENVFMFAPKHQ